MSTKINLKNVRLSYAYLHNPYTSTNEKGESTKTYTTHAILDPDHPQIAELKEIMRKVAITAWADQGEATLQQLAAQGRICLRQGDVYKPNEIAYKGKLYLTANNKNRPTLVETRGGVNVQLTEADGKPYSGCYANVILNIWAMDGKKAGWGKRICASLEGVQFIRHGEAFGGARVAQVDEFGLQEVDGADAPVPTPAATSATAGLF
jgi:Protein of unknown function (DUF2815)